MPQNAPPNFYTPEQLGTTQSRTDQVNERLNQISMQGPLNMASIPRPEALPIQLATQKFAPPQEKQLSIWDQIADRVGFPGTKAKPKY